MKSLARDLGVLVVGFAVIGAVAIGFNSAGAQESPTAPFAESTPIGVVSEVSEPVAVTVTGAPAPSTTLAPPKPATATAPVAVTSKPATTKPVIAPSDDVEIGTACVLTRNPDGTVTSEGC